MKPMKKLLSSFLIAATLFFSFVPYFSAVKAQTWYSQDPFEWYVKVYDQNVSPSNEIFGERYTAAQVQWVVYSFLFMPLRMVESVTGENSIACLFKGFQNETDIVTCAKGFDGIMTNVMNLVTKYMTPDETAQNQSLLQLAFNSNGRAISGIGYTKQLFNKLSPVSTVKAQGVGYTGLTWIQQYWVGFRNMAYILIVLVVIIFAFMIMFRVKLNPQTVISIQVALPKIITALILVTFSYAIAGFAIDLMYVVSGLFTLLLEAGNFASASNATSVFTTISGTAWGYNTPLGGLWILIEMLGYFVMFLIAAIFALVSTLVGGLNIFGMLLSVIYILVAVWVLILAIWYTFKVPYVLLKTVISLYLSIISAPIQIAAGALVPSMGFGNWFKRLMADVLVFPVTGLLFWLAWYTLWQSYIQSGWDIARFWTFFGAGQAQPVAWIPGIIGVTTWGRGGISGIIFLSISFGMIVLIPKVPNVMKSFLLGEKFSFGTAMGEAYGPIGGAVKQVTGVASGVATGQGAIRVGSWLKKSNIGVVSRFGEGLEGYGNKSLGNFGTPTTTVKPGQKGP